MSCSLLIRGHSCNLRAWEVIASLQDSLQHVNMLTCLWVTVMPQPLWYYWAQIPVPSPCSQSLTGFLTPSEELGNPWYKTFLYITDHKSDHFSILFSPWQVKYTLSWDQFMTKGRGGMSEYIFFMLHVRMHKKISVDHSLPARQHRNGTIWEGKVVGRLNPSQPSAS